MQQLLSYIRICHKNTIQIISFIKHMYNYSALHSSYFDITVTYITECCSVCVVFGLSMFAGVVVNAIYATNNTVSIDDICDQSTDIANDICDALRRVRDSEVAAAVSCENAS